MRGASEAQGSGAARSARARAPQLRASEAGARRGAQLAVRGGQGAAVKGAARLEALPPLDEDRRPDDQTGRVGGGEQPRARLGLRRRQRGARARVGETEAERARGGHGERAGELAEELKVEGGLGRAQVGADARVRLRGERADRARAQRRPRQPRPQPRAEQRHAERLVVRRDEQSAAERLARAADRRARRARRPLLAGAPRRQLLGAAQVALGQARPVREAHREHHALRGGEELVGRLAAREEVERRHAHGDVPHVRVERGLGQADALRLRRKLRKRRVDGVEALRVVERVHADARRPELGEQQPREPAAERARGSLLRLREDEGGHPDGRLDRTRRHRCRGGREKPSDGTSSC